MSIRLGGYIAFFAVSAACFIFAGTAKATWPDRIAGAKVIKVCKTRAHPDLCRYKRVRLLAIRPHIDFLRVTGACETATTDLKSGLRTHDLATGVTYHGRYQMNEAAWDGARGTFRISGAAHAHDATWLEQAYRAVRWVRIHGGDPFPNC
jgi:hypothetical protein